VSTQQRWLALLVPALAATLVACGGGGASQSKSARPQAAAGPLPPIVHGAHPQFGFSGAALGLLGLHDPQQIGAVMQRAGATVLRLEIPWDQLGSATPKPGVTPVFNFIAYTALRASLKRHGVRPLLAIMAPPRWALPANFKCPDGSAACYGAPTRQSLPQLALLAAAAVRFFPNAVAVEAFNEPNTAVNWAPRVDPRGYLRALRSVRRGVRSASKRIPVITGGLINFFQGHPGDMDVPEFLEALYRAGGKGSFDGIGLHPYQADKDPSAPNSLWRQRLEAARTIAARNGDAGIPIYITESGYPTGGEAAWTIKPSDAEQSRLERCSYLLEAGSRDVAVILHNMIFDEPKAGGDTIEQHWGFVGADGSAKPALNDFGAMLRRKVTAVQSCQQVR
jgi:hypothetical protein